MAHLGHALLNLIGLGTHQQAAQAAQLPEKLEKTLDLLSENPTMSDAELAQVLGLASETVAHYWRTRAEQELSRTAHLPESPERGHLAQTAVVPVPHLPEEHLTTIEVPPPLTAGRMTPEQLKARRIIQIENADVGKSKHVRFFIFLVTCWLFVGPPWYVALTTSEVGWALSGRSWDWHDQTSNNFYAGALFIELGLMFCTFFLAYLRQLQSNQEGRNQLTNRAITGLTLIWLILAGISAFGQFYYLFNASGVDRSSFHIAFVTSRVIAFTVVDFASAFYLSRIQSTLDEIMEANRKKGKYHVDMAEVDGELLKKEAEAEMKVEQARIDMEDKRQKNQIANRVITIMTEAGLKTIEEKFNQPQLPPPGASKKP